MSERRSGESRTMVRRAGRGVVGAAAAGLLVAGLASCVPSRSGDAAQRDKQEEAARQRRKDDFNEQAKADGFQSAREDDYSSYRRPGEKASISLAIGGCSFGAYVEVVTEGDRVTDLRHYNARILPDSLVSYEFERLQELKDNVLGDRPCQRIFDASGRRHDDPES